LVLQREGFQSLEAGTGVEAIKKAIAEKPDVIMLDLELPDMEGAKVARILKNHSHTATIPIVGWTGYII
jgi:CheY-like chemotaxis protein